MKVFTVSLKKSLIGAPEVQRRTVRSLGLSKFGRSVEIADNAANRGKLMKVQHLVEVKLKG